MTRKILLLILLLIYLYLKKEPVEDDNNPTDQKIEYTKHFPFRIK